MAVSTFTWAALPAPWQALLQPVLARSSVQAIGDFLAGEIAAGKIIRPEPARIFAAFARTPPTAIKVVILGQDPYFNPGEAHGFAFSVPPGVKVPSSLRNILKEVQADVGGPLPQDGCLERWADQGVLLLNSVLSVEQGLKESHARCGWQDFTDGVIRAISAECPQVVFLLWGRYADSKSPLIADRHLILRSTHPSGLSAYRASERLPAFIGSRPFSQANQFLARHGLGPIDWAGPGI